MSIQTRFLLALGLVLIGCVLALSLAIQTHTLPKLAQWETEEAHAQNNRAQRAIEREFDHLLIYAREWAVWDDTFRFVQDPQPEYVHVNLDVGNFNAASVDLLAFFNNDGRPVWAGIREGETVNEQSGTSLADEIWSQALSALGGNSSAVGILHSSRGLVMVAIHKVSNSRESEPPQGVLLAARLMDEEFMMRLRQQMELDVAIAPMANISELIGPSGTVPELPESGQPVVRSISGSRLQLFARFPDMSGQATLVTKINLSRKVFAQGETIIRQSLILTVGLFSVALFVAWLLMRHLVFLPIAALARHTSELHDSGDYTRRFGHRRSDELGNLAREFDELLNRVETQAEDLKRLSFEDALTGVKNRRYFDEQLRSAWAMLRRTDQPLSLLILDVDDFKRYNDHYGHQQGDAALRTVAQVVRDVLRRTVDTVARYGGEEFAAILPGTSLADAQLMAERVRTEVMALALPHETSQVGDVVTVTIGVASISAGSDMNAEALLRMADQALYAAKHSGKNKVMVAPESALKSRSV